MKRRPGGGRRPKGEFSQLSSTLTIRIPDEMRKQLEDEAANKHGPETNVALAPVV